MKKKFFILLIMIMTCLCACSKSNNQKVKENETVEATNTQDDKKEDTSKDNTEEKKDNSKKKSEKESDTEKTPYAILDFETEEVIEYLPEDDELVERVCNDAFKFYATEMSMKYDDVENGLKYLVEKHIVSDKLFSDDTIKETVKKYKDKRIQQDYISSEISCVLINEEKNAAKVFAEVAFLNTDVKRTVATVVSQFEYDKEYDIWTYCGDYSYEERLEE